MRRLAQAGAITTVGVGISALLGWARVKGLAVELGSAGLGVYGQVWSFVLYAGSLGALGIGIGVTRVIALERERGNTEGLRAAVRATVLLPPVVGLGLGIVTVALSPLLTPLLIDSDEYWILAIAAASLPFVALHAPLEHLLQGFEDPKGQTASYVAYSLFFTVTAVAGAAVAGVTGAVVGLSAGNALLALLYLARTRTVVSPFRQLGFRGALRDWLAGLGPVARTLLRIGAASLTVTAVFAFADLAVRTTILQTEGEAQAGVWYALTVISVQFIGALAGALTFLTAPLAARASAEPGRAATSPVVDDTWRLTLVAVIPVIAMIVALREQVVPIFFTGEFSEAAGYLPAQAVGDTCRSLAWAAGVALVPLGLTRAWLAIGVVSSIAYGVVGAFGGARWGLDGAVAAWIVSWAISLAATVLVLLRVRAWRPSGRALAGASLTVPMLAAATALPPLPAALAVVAATGVLLRVALKPSELRTGWRAGLRFLRRAPESAPPAA